MNTERLNDTETIVKNLGITNPRFSIADLPDAEIWHEFKAGNEGAFNHIYRTYFQEIYQYGHQFTSDSGLIKDLLQDLLIDIRKNRNKLGEAPSIKFYLFKAFRRKVFRYLKQNRLVYFSKIEFFSNIVIESSHEVKLLESQLDSEKRKALEVALLNLSKRQRECIYYYFYQSMSYGEVASIMGLNNVKSARNLIYKSIDALNSQLEPQKNNLLAMFFAL